MSTVFTEKNFMGTAWDFYVTADGKAFWVNTKTGTVVPSSRNPSSRNRSSLDQADRT